MRVCNVDHHGDKIKDKQSVSVIHCHSCETFDTVQKFVKSVFGVASWREVCVNEDDLLRETSQTVTPWLR